MRMLMLTMTLVLALAAPAAAQDSLWTYIMRCAVGGAHLEGCALSDQTCTFAEHLAGTCGTTSDPAPQPEPDPEPPPPAGLAAPTDLQDLGSALTARHDGAGVEWFTLRLSGAYHTHVGTVALVDGTVTIPLGALAPGSYDAVVQACSDALGCTDSAPLEVRR